MKQLASILFLLIVFCNPSFAQNEKPFFRHQISGNVNTIFERFIFKPELKNVNFLEPPFEHQTTQLSYLYFFPNTNTALKIGEAYHLQTRQRITVIDQELSTRKMKRQSWFFKIGIQRNFNLSKKIKPYLGVDFMYQNQLKKNKRTITGLFIQGAIHSISVTKNNNFGLISNLGIQYFFSKKISISSEVNIEIISFHEKHKSQLLSENSTSSKYEKTKSSLTFDLRSPLALFLNFHF